jgi:lipid-binding SYLF domain-containing protein
MYRYLNIVFCFSLALTTLFAVDKTKEEERQENDAVVMEEIMGMPDTIPQDLLDKAECIVVIPSVTKVAIGIGGSYGRGAMVCRTGPQFNGPWGAPAMYALEGGSIGFQLGGQATDLVLLVMNDRGADSILRSGVKLGAEVSAVAGPKGREAQAATDAYMRAEILSYSRSRGLFAGISLAGTSLRSDDDANERIYGQRISPRDIVLDSKFAVPPAGNHLVRVLQKSAPRNQSDQAAVR